MPQSNTPQPPPTNQGQWIKYLNSSSLTSIFSSLDSCASLKSVSFIANHYFKIFTNRLTMDTKIEVAENQRLVLLPTSNFEPLLYWESHRQYHSAVTNSKVKEWFRPYSNPRLQFAVYRLRPHESTLHYHEDRELSYHAMANALQQIHFLIRDSRKYRDG